MSDKTLHYWEITYPKAAATGLQFARGRMDPTQRLIVHAAPDIMTVEVYDTDRHVIARGTDLAETADTPMAVLRIEGDRIVREDTWPTDADIGTPVLLPGGETGILQSWWNADDHSEWRWHVEFYNSRG